MAISIFFFYVVEILLFMQTDGEGKRGIYQSKLRVFFYFYLLLPFSAISHLGFVIQEPQYNKER